MERNPHKLGPEPARAATPPPLPILVRIPWFTAACVQERIPEVVYHPLPVIVPKRQTVVCRAHPPAVPRRIHWRSVAAVPLVVAIFLGISWYAWQVGRTWNAPDRIMTSGEVHVPPASPTCSVSLSPRIIPVDE